jgi:hypothetical protein
MFGALIRAADRWRGLRFTEFELRQIAAVRKELDQEYKASITPLARSFQPRVSSKSVPTGWASAPPLGSVFGSIESSPRKGYEHPRPFVTSPQSNSGSGGCKDVSF